MSNRPRLVDVAAELGLAPSTVSRALAGSSAVSEATRARVEAAAKALGYTPNRAASGLKRGHSYNIGLVAVMNHWYSGAVTSGADSVAAGAGYDFVVMNSAGGTNDALMLERARRLGTRVDGALMLDISPEAGMLDRLVEAVRVPVVTLGCEADDCAAVLVDNEQIGSVAGRHLAELGHRRSAVLWMSPPSSTAIDNGSMRARGFRAGFGGDPVVAWQVPRDDRERRQAMILEAAEGVTAMFCASDALAIEALALVRSAGRSVPESLSIVGVDDHPLAQPLGLTTIAQSPESMGERAAELLLERIGPARPLEAEAARVIAPTQLLIRQTTGPT